MAPYRPPGRSNRSGRSNADNDVFEGLPVKQWGQPYSRVSLAAPVSEVQPGQDDKWADAPMPRDYQLLQPWTQYILRLARSGKVGTKRKQEADATDDDRHEDEANEENAAKSSNLEERGYVVKKWKPVPEHLLVQEHKHFEFLAKRRRGLPSLYAPDQHAGAPIPMRKTKVQKTDANGEVALYEVLVPEGQAVDGEVTDTTEIPDVKPVAAAPGTVIEGVGIANDDGILVAEHLKPSISSRRNRPPPKKKGGPGRGKKRVTFTNPDGSTYTTIVPNATKIVPQPGQIVKHVAKGEEASADVTAEEAAAATAARQGDNSEEGSGSEDGEDDDDDREEGEVSDEDAPGTGAATPAKPQTPAKDAFVLPRSQEDATPMEDVRPAEIVAVVVEEPGTNTDEAVLAPIELPTSPPAVEEAAARDPSSSPDIPLATNTHSRTGSMTEPPPALLDVLENGNAALLAETIVEVPTTAVTTEEPMTEGRAQVSEPERESEVEPQPESEHASQSEPEHVTKPEPEPEPEHTSKPETELAPEPEPEPKAKAGVDFVHVWKTPPLLAPEFALETASEPSPEIALDSATEAALEPTPKPATLEESDDDLLGNLEKYI